MKGYKKLSACALIVGMAMLCTVHVPCIDIHGLIAIIHTAIG